MFSLSYWRLVIFSSQELSTLQHRHTESIFIPFRFRVGAVKETIQPTVGKEGDRLVVVSLMKSSRQPERHVPREALHGDSYGRTPDKFPLILRIVSGTCQRPTVSLMLIPFFLPRGCRTLLIQKTDASGQLGRMEGKKTPPIP